LFSDYGNQRIHWNRYHSRSSHRIDGDLLLNIFVAGELDRDGIVAWTDRTKLEVTDGIRIHRLNALHIAFKRHFDKFIGSLRRRENQLSTNLILLGVGRRLLLRSWRRPHLSKKGRHAEKESRWNKEFLCHGFHL